MRFSAPIRYVLLTCLFISCCATTNPKDGLLITATQGTEQPTSDHINLEGEINGDSADTFIRELKVWEESGAKEVSINLNSPGGSIFAGFQISKALEHSKLRTTCVVDNLAASIALYVLQSCTVRQTTGEGILMAHAAATSAQGNSHEIAQTMEELRLLDKVIAFHNSLKTKLTVGQYEAKISDGKEFWMTANEALAYGFVDEIVAKGP